jgi:NNP family nitrate/nitrite transporter-like MFS transporter
MQPPNFLRDPRFQFISTGAQTAESRHATNFYRLEDAQTLQVTGGADGTRRRRRLSFDIVTDPLQADRATEIRLLSFQRPHMRAFHFSWMSFFFAFFGWFSIPPLMPTIKKQLKLTDDQVANSDIASVASTIVGRVVVGPLCDQYGGRVVQAVLLVLGAFPVAAAALATDYAGLVTIRFFIGLIGCSFVATAYWTSVMFSNEVVASANAIATGWGNLGAGVTYLVTPLLFDLVTINGAVGDDVGWRITLLFPALCMAVIGVCLYYFSDDCPQGNYRELRKNQAMDADVSRPEEDMQLGLLTVIRKPVTWILLLQYACSFGVEIQVHNALSLFYYEDFKVDGCDVEADANDCRQLSQTKASLISSCFGLMCIFARTVGGYASDVANRKFAMRGRISVQFVAFACQTVSLYLFSQMKTLRWSIPSLILFGICAQACTGSTFGLVPYVCPEHTGATSGVVGAGGNLGGLTWGILFKGIGNRAKSFELLSLFVALSALMSVAIHVDGEPSLWQNEESLSTSTAPTENMDERDTLPSTTSDRSSSAR